MTARRFLALVVGLSGLSLTGVAEETTLISDGSLVQIEYTLSLADGSVVQSNVEQEPLAYVQGSGQLLPSLEQQLVGRAANDEVDVTLEAADAYGPVDEALFRTVPLEQLPEDARSVGTLLRADGFEGPIRVSEVTDENAVLDFNHPLAGEDLTFKIKVLSVAAGPAPVPEG
jgi:peptidylprolyl isomerase